MSKKNKAKSVTGIAHAVRDKIAVFRHKLDDIKKEKERDYVEALLPEKPKVQTTMVELVPASVAKSALLTLFIFFLLYFLYQIDGILLIFFTAFLFAAALDPIVDRMQAHGVPRAVGVLIIYTILFFFAGIFIEKVVTLMAQQVVEIAGDVGEFVTHLTTQQASQFPFAKQLQPYLQQFYETVNLQTAAFQLQNALQILSAQLLSISFGLFNVLIILILTFFMTVEEKSIEEFFLSLFPSRYAHYITTRLDAVKNKIGNWLRGQFVVSIIAAILTYIGLVIMGVHYALTLSIISGVCMMVPVIGRGIAWIITFPIVFNQLPILSLWVSLYYLAINQVENNILIPYVMNKTVGLNPIVTAFAMMVGTQYLGVLGLILAIPIATTLSIFVHDYTLRSK